MQGVTAMSSAMPRFEVRPSATAAETLWVPVFQDARKKPFTPAKDLAERVRLLSRAEVMTGAAKSIQFLRYAGGKGAEHALLSGMGQPDVATAEELRQSGASVGVRLKAEKVGSVHLRLEDLRKGLEPKGRLSWEEALEALLEGLALSRYEVLHRKSGKDANRYKQALTIAVVASSRADQTRVKGVFDRVTATAESMFVTRDWSNEPANFGTPEFYSQQAMKIARAHGLKARVMKESECRREKMGLLLAVGQGSERESRVVIVEYSPKGAERGKSLVLVGKGVTFDTGGISIKPSAKMEDMKHDMSGAATVFGAILLASRLKVRNRVVAIMGFVENMPDGTAVLPSAVVAGRNGKTVEIINTDAEGRLVLADLLDYSKHFKPDAIVDVATLTGAVGYVLGNQACGLFANDDSLAEQLSELGERTGERMWHLPLFDGYLNTLRSEYADLKNCSASAEGGTATAAMFLKQFVPKDVAWAHLDIAYTAWDLGHLPYHPKKGGSGAHVRALARLAAEL
ncbi:MAG: leucyl aminopeptidase family protein [Bdellovibrionales bacterium]|nr:leucyl aminopeptidase family protein [Bdellovibrionales bacterium]